MFKQARILWFALAALVLLAALAAFLLSRVDGKSRFEAVVSEATGLEVAVGGSVSIGLFPSPHLDLQNVTLRNQESDLASVGEARVGVAWWPLLRRQVRIKRLALRNVSVTIERNRDGHFNFARPSQSTRRTWPAMRLGRVSLAKASVRYRNHQTDKELEATDCQFDTDAVQLAEGSPADIMRHLSLTARGACAEVRNPLLAGTDVVFSVAGQQGIFQLTPVTMQMMGGKGEGRIDADFTGTIPAYRVRYSLTQLHVNDLFRSLSPGKLGRGVLDFTTDLTMRGFNATEMTCSTQGEASLHGENLEVAIGNLDEKLSRYASSQNFNLVDLGAFFIAGPLGTAVTKGYNFASIFRDTKGNTNIRTLVSRWKVENGVAHAQDVAMATKENRLAMKGALDFCTRDFDEVVVAVVDDKGCATVEQRIRGPFNGPKVVKPNVLASLTGPVRNVVSDVKDLMGVKCEIFYEGSIVP